MRVAGYIERRSMLYKTGVEYGDYTMNHVLGCAHGCKYPCYAFMMKKRFGIVPSYENWIKPYLVANTIELLDQEIPRLRDQIQSVHLCFTTDPFMHQYQEIRRMSLNAIQRLNRDEIKCTVLTKGLLPIELADCYEENEYGITLVSLVEAFRKRMEPHSAKLRNRLASLEALHNRGCYTWVSIEPYPTPNLVRQDLTDLLDAVAFTDKIIFGRTNYSKDVSAYAGHKEFYNECAQEVIEFCNAHDIQYHIKKGTLTDE